MIHNVVGFVNMTHGKRMVNSVIYYINVPSSFKTAVVAELKNSIRPNDLLFPSKKPSTVICFRRRKVHVKKRRKHLQEERR